MVTFRTNRIFCAIFVGRMIDLHLEEIASEGLISKGGKQYRLA